MGRLRIKKDDLISLGTWEGRPMRWRFLSVDKDKILVISEKILDAAPFAGGERSYRAVLWSRSPIRERLQRIYEQCFTDEEKDCIHLSYLSLNTIDENGRIDVLDSAEDYLFLPAHEDILSYFEEDRVCYTKNGVEKYCKNMDRLCEAEETAVRNLPEPDEDEERYKPLSPSAYSAYWLRDPTQYMDDWNRAVSYNGQIQARNSYKPLGIRPCMHIAKKEYPVAGTFRYEEKPLAEVPHEYEKIRFGQWEGKPLQWLILKKEEDRIMVISEKGIIPMPFHDGWRSADHYGVSDARRWINEEFYEQAFSAEEKERICVTAVRIPKSPTDISKWKGPDDCYDPMFLLLYSEVSELFPNHIDLFCYPLSGGKKPVGWWLRDHCTLADQENAIAERWIDDYYANTYLPQSRKDIYVRPAMWLKREG